MLKRKHWVWPFGESSATMTLIERQISKVFFRYNLEKNKTKIAAIAKIEYLQTHIGSDIILGCQNVVIRSRWNEIKSELQTQSTSIRCFYIFACTWLSTIRHSFEHMLARLLKSIDFLIFIFFERAVKLLAKFSYRLSSLTVGVCLLSDICILILPVDESVELCFHECLPIGQPIYWRKRRNEPTLSQ